MKKDEKVEEDEEDLMRKKTFIILFILCSVRADAAS